MFLWHWIIHSTSHWSVCYTMSKVTGLWKEDQCCKIWTLRHMIPYVTMGITKTSARLRGYLIHPDILRHLVWWVTKAALFAASLKAKTRKKGSSSGLTHQFHQCSRYWTSISESGSMGLTIKDRFGSKSEGMRGMCCRAELTFPSADIATIQI